MMRILVLGAVLGGCAPPVVQSALVESSDMTATYSVRTSADGTTAHVRASFSWWSGMASVVLDDGDSVSIDGIVLDGGLEDPENYETDVPIAAEHVFVLTRGSELIEHRVISPLPFTISSRPFNGTYDDLEARLTWAPVVPGAVVNIVARGTTTECPSVTLTSSNPDIGWFAFTGAELEPAQVGEMPPPPCAFTLEITRNEFLDGAASPLKRVSLIKTHAADSTMVTVSGG